MSRAELETGRYTIVNPAFGKVIGGSPTKPVVRPVQAIGNVGSIKEPVVGQPLFTSDPHTESFYRCSSSLNVLKNAVNGISHSIVSRSMSKW